MRITILGGGVVGLTLANLLAANSELQISILEPHVPKADWDDNFYDLRCSAITPANVHLFKQMRIWDEVAAARFGFYDQMLVWDQELHRNVHLSALQIQQLALGYIVENRVLAKALYQKLQHSNNVQFIAKHACKVEQRANSICVASDEGVLESDLLVGADGANSWLRQQLQFVAYEHDYKQSALVATIECEHPHNNTAMQRFKADGPLAFLPLDQDNFCSIVWTSDHETIEQLMCISAREFCQILAAEFAYKYGNLQLHGARAKFKLRALQSTAYVTSRIALIGDAAHVVHPMAGLGLNLGLNDCSVLSKVIFDAHASQQDIGKISVLRRFERQCKAHNLKMAAIVEVLKRTYASQNPLVSSLRGAGMQILDNLVPAKNAIMRLATGVSN